MSPAPAHSVTDQFARTPTGGAGMPDRYTASTITDDALDALYAERDRLREQQAGYFQQMAAAREQGRRWWQRTQRAERALERIEQMATAWQERLPEAIRTATAVDAIRAALEGQQQEVAP